MCTRPKGAHRQEKTIGYTASDLGPAVGFFLRFPVFFNILLIMLIIIQNVILRRTSRK